MSLKALVPGALATGAAGATSVGCYFQMSHVAVSSASEDAQELSDPLLANLAQAASGLQELLPSPKESTPSPESKSSEEGQSTPSPVLEQKTLEDQPQKLGDASPVANADSDAGSGSSSQSSVEETQGQPKPDSVPQAENSSITDNRQPSDNLIIPRSEDRANKSSSVPAERTYDENRSSRRPKPKTRSTRRGGPWVSFCLSSPVPIPFVPGCK